MAGLPPINNGYGFARCWQAKFCRVSGKINLQQRKLTADSRARRNTTTAHTFE